MFSNLIESGSHGRDLKRKGSFFIGTLLFYAVLLTGAGVGSIYAYNVRLDAENEYEISIIRFSAEEKAAPQKTRVQPKTAATSSGGGKPQTAMIKTLVVDHPLPPGREVAPEGSRVLPRNMDYEFGDREYIPPTSGGGGGPDKGIASSLPGGGGKNVTVETGDIEAPEVKIAKPTPTPVAPKRQETLRVTSQVLSGKAVSKPAPPYPPLARQIKQQGTVAVQIVVDEQGRVVSAKAASGPPLLLVAAERAAYQARFTPTMLNGQPVKISGVITYNFILQ